MQHPFQTKGPTLYAASQFDPIGEEASTLHAFQRLRTTLPSTALQEHKVLEALAYHFKSNSTALFVMASELCAHSTLSVSPSPPPFSFSSPSPSPSPPPPPPLLKQIHPRSFASMIPVGPICAICGLHLHRTKMDAHMDAHYQSNKRQQKFQLSNSKKTCPQLEYWKEISNLNTLFQVGRALPVRSVEDPTLYPERLVKRVEEIPFLAVTCSTCEHPYCKYCKQELQVSHHQELDQWVLSQGVDLLLMHLQLDTHAREKKRVLTKEEKENASCFYTWCSFCTTQLQQYVHSLLQTCPPFIKTSARADPSLQCKLCFTMCGDCVTMHMDTWWRSRTPTPTIECTCSLSI